MKILYYDCFAGISGDMHLGALIDLGVPAQYLKDELKKLNLEGYELIIESGLKMGISGTKVTVNLTHHHHHHHASHHGHHHEHRNLDAIRTIINSSTLSDAVKKNSLLQFEYIARAEAKIHAKSIDQVHFHEVGAIDSIIDMVGAAICIDYLKPERILASTVELGGGFVHCAHGTFPVPAPATAEILSGVPVRTGTVLKETTTPTGAAILKTFVDEFTDQHSFTPEKTAYGIGQRDMEIPNVLRVFWGTADSTAGTTEHVTALLVECNIDDMNPEHYDFVMEKLFDAGAHDVFMIPIIMKKSRPAIQLKVLCSNHQKATMEAILLTETTTLGTRSYPVAKSMLQRKTRNLETPYGTIRIKESYFNKENHKFKAEYDDCAQAARTHKVRLQEVYDSVYRLLNYDPK